MSSLKMTVSIKTRLLQFNRRFLAINEDPHHLDIAVSAFFSSPWLVGREPRQLVATKPFQFRQF